VAIRKITIEVEVPEGFEWVSDAEGLIGLLRKGAPLGVKQKDLRRTKIYANRSRY